MEAVRESRRLAQQRELKRERELHEAAERDAKRRKAEADAKQKQDEKSKAILEPLSKDPVKIFLIPVPTGVQSPIFDLRNFQQNQAVPPPVATAAAASATAAATPEYVQSEQTGITRNSDGEVQIIVAKEPNSTASH